MKEIIKLKNYTNKGERLDDLCVYRDGDMFVCHKSDGSVFFSDNDELMFAEDDYIIPWCKIELDYNPFDEIFYYEGKYGYLDVNMQWVFTPHDTIEECEFYGGD